MALSDLVKKNPRASMKRDLDFNHVGQSEEILSPNCAH